MVKNKILKYLLYYISLLFATFTVYVLGYSLITSTIFHFFNLPLNYLLYILLVSIVVTIILVLILKIESINAYFQTSLIYITYSISIYVIGFVTKCFIMNSTFWISSILINLVGAIIILSITLINRSVENKRLNRILNEYKEKKSYEK